MRYWYQAPQPRLADYIRTVLVVDMCAQDDHTMVPLVLAGMPAVVVQWTPCNAPVDSGGSTADADVDIILFGTPVPADFKLSPRHALTIAYFFTPFSLSTLFDVAAGELAKSSAGFEYSNNAEALKLKTRLYHAQGADEVVDILNAFFVALLARHYHTCEMIRTATDAIMVDPSVDILSQLPDRLHTTRRTFQRMFKKYVGISPTEYRRICQFQQSFQQVRNGQFDKLSDVAADNGFADQSHFVRSFREFSRTTPGKYLDEGLKQK